MRHPAAPINADVHRIGVHARQVGVKHVVITGAVEVHRHGQWDSGGSGRCTEQLRGESVDVTEGIGMKHSNHLLDVGCRTLATATGVGWLRSFRFSTPPAHAPGVSALRPDLRR